MQLNYLTIYRSATTDLLGETPDDVQFFHAPNHEIDSAAIFRSRNLLMFSNYLNLAETKEAAACNVSMGEIPCMFGGCFDVSQRCDGNQDCQDGYDERGCVEEVELQLDQIKKYRLSR